jgi:hypothetical protein
MLPISPSRILLNVCIMSIVVTNAFGQTSEDFSNSFVAGREYFMLRSGNAKLVLQSDKSGMQPAVTYMLFDANRPCQTLRKDRAFNYVPGSNCQSSALEVVLRGVSFTAVAHVAGVHWSYADGVPSVEAQWWAGGIRVTESFTALEAANTFIRKITLEGKDIAGPDSVRLRLHLPAGRFFSERSMLVGIAENTALGIGFMKPASGIVNAQDGFIETDPIRITPGHEVVISTLLTTRIPAAGYSYSEECGDDHPLDPHVLRSGAQAGALMGMKGEYFNNIDLHGTPTVVRVDTNFCPYWGVGTPAEGIHPDSFSVRWTGLIVPRFTGRYRFSMAADDGARLFIDDTLLIHCKDGYRHNRLIGDRFLESGKSYNIRIEFIELLGWAGIRVRCAVPGPAADEPVVKSGVQALFDALARMSDSQAAHELTATRASWSRMSAITTEDSLVRSLFNNARYALPGMVGSIGKMDAGMFEYGDQWVRDGSNVALGLIHAGNFELARTLLTFLLSDLLSDEGNAISSGAFDNPDREEYDQMGELVHALKSYRDWTGDSQLIMNFRAKIIALIERPIQARYRDSTGMVHNRREYWERTFDDGYELAYQTFIIRGLRDAADLAHLLGVPEKAPYWRAQADIFQQAMLHHPSRSLVDKGMLIKRRNVDGTFANFIPGPPADFKRDDPAATEAYRRLNPDASSVLPIVLRVVDPRSSLARNTLDKLEEIWNARWDFGGYERYHSSSQQDQPGPWTFATSSIARAQLDAGLYTRSRRSLEWLLNVQGGNAGAWFEEVPVIRSQIPTAGIVPWTSAEATLLAVRHWLGLSFDGDDLVLRPALFPGHGGCKADLRFRSSRLKIEIDKPGDVRYALVNGRKMLPDRDGSLRVPAGMLSGNVEITVQTK